MTVRPERSAAPVQRLLGYNENKTLYFVKSKIDAALGDKASRIGQWKTNVLAHLSGWDLESTSAVTWSDFKSLYGIESDDAAAKSQLESIDAAALYYFKKAVQEGTVGDTQRLFQPKDLLDEADDLARDYDVSKGCVLQALVNAGVSAPTGMVGDATDPAVWHNHYYNTKGMVYDSDVEIFKIYTGLGLQLVWNRPLQWSDDKLKGLKSGWYVFTMPGHNFAVKVDKSKSEPADRFKPKDEPQRRVLRYTADQTIKYVWKV